MFNSKEYEWSNTSVILGGKNITGIRGVEYKEALEKEYMYAKGDKPIGIQHGNYSYDGKITILQSELIALQEAAKMVGKNLLKLSFSIVVAYGNPLNGDIIHTDTLLGVEFTDVSKAMKQGDKRMEVELPIMFLDIKNN